MPTNQARTTPPTSILGPVFVALGAALWATDSLPRAALVQAFPAVAIVTISHLVSLLYSLPLAWYARKEMRQITKREWGALLYLSAGGSAMAMVLFTLAFKTTTNYTIPILLQKLQPIFAMWLAGLILKEAKPKGYDLHAAVAIVGSYLVSFGAANPLRMLESVEFVPSLYAIAAAAIWAGCTVAGRFLASNRSFVVITASRYILATAILSVGAALYYGKDLLRYGQAAWQGHLGTFWVMATIPGFLALLTYYYGLRQTSARTATICELSFPVTAIALNWIVFDAALGVDQIIGAVLVAWGATRITFSRATPI